MLVLARKQVLKFLNQHQFIEDWSDVEDFKNLVRPQMYAALWSIPLMLIGLGMFFISFHRIGSTLFLPFLLLEGVTLTLAEIGKKAERRSRNLICTTEELELKYQQICKSWTDDAFPKF